MRARDGIDGRGHDLTAPPVLILCGGKACASIPRRSCLRGLRAVRREVHALSFGPRLRAGSALFQ